MRRLTQSWPKRPFLALLGFAGLIFGALFLILPGPGLVMIAAGLSILGAEYAWARRGTRRVRDYLRRRGW